MTHNREKVILILFHVTKVDVLDEESPSTSMRLTDASKGRWPLAKLLNSIEKTYDKKNYFLLIEKNTESRHIGSFHAPIGETTGMSFEQRKYYIKENNWSASDTIKLINQEYNNLQIKLKK